MITFIFNLGSDYNPQGNVREAAQELRSNAVLINTFKENIPGKKWFVLERTIERTGSFEVRILTIQHNALPMRNYPQVIREITKKIWEIVLFWIELTYFNLPPKNE